MTGVACACLVWLAHLTPTLRSVEEWSLDNRILLRGARTSTTRLLLVNVDDASLTQLGKPLMFCSPELAEVIRFLHSQKCAAVGVDLLLPERERTSEFLLPGQPGDSEQMGQAVTWAGNVVLPQVLVPGGVPVRPAYEWRSAAPAVGTDLGFVNLTVDADGFIRRQKLRIKDDRGGYLPCFALAVLGKSRRLPDSWLAAPQLEFEGRPLPLDAEGYLRLNYVGPPGSLPTVSFAEVLNAARGTKRLGFDLRDSIVLIGASDPLESDRHATPYLNQSLFQIVRNNWLGQQAEMMSGLEIHAHLIATLADRAYVTTPWWLSPFPLLVLVGALLGAALARLNLAWGLALIVTHHVAWRVVCLGAFVGGGWQVDLTPMLLLGMLVYGVSFALRWRWMRRMLGLVKSEAIACALEGDPGQLDRIGREAEITVLFSDIRNFTRYSETHAPRDVVRLLNEYFTAVVPILEAEGGTIAQYNGDGVMVMFGAPRRDDDHAAHGVRSALRIVREVHRLADRWRALDASLFRIGVGVHTGTAIVGVVGSPSRLDYTAHGDTVNTAAHRSGK